MCDIDREKLKQYSVDVLIDLALKQSDYDNYWTVVGSLQTRGTQAVLDAMYPLSASQRREERILAADVLAQLGVPERTFPKESVALLLKMLSVEDDNEVLPSIITAFGHNDNDEIPKALATFYKRPEPDVREAVAFALSSKYEDALTIEMLINLSMDEVRDVRDWAVFSFMYKNADTPPIREALWRRVQDEDFEIRAEAILGLARRKDPQIVDVLIRELSQEEDLWWDLVEAAEELADPRLCPILETLKNKWSDEPSIDSALEACKCE